MEREASKMFFSLIRSAIGGAMLSNDEKNLFSREMLPELIALAKRHDIAQLLAIALIDNGLVSNGSSGARNEIAKAVYRYELLRHELSSLCVVLEDAKIAHVALKGATMRNYYPKPYMRTSSDVDILVRPDDVERAVAVLTDSSYELIGRGLHDVSFQSPSKQLIELHFDLLEEGRLDNSSDIIKVLRSAWEYAVRVDGYEYRYELSDEFFYFYHIAHMAKHFEGGGCGIRPFIDLYLLEKEKERRGERDALLSEGGLLTFAEAARGLMRVWFLNEPHSELTEKMENYLLSGGLFGSIENRVSARQKKHGGKVGYIFSRIFAPYEKLRGYYPILEKHRWLTPLMQVRRWFMIFKPGIAKMAKDELRANKSSNKNDAEMINELLCELELQ